MHLLALPLRLLSALVLVHCLALLARDLLALLAVLGVALLARNLLACLLRYGVQILREINSQNSLPLRFNDRYLITLVHWLLGNENRDHGAGTTQL